jgi:hypothetical protein
MHCQIVRSKKNMPNLLDTMVGFYDKLFVQGNEVELQIARAIPYMLFGDDEGALNNYKENCIRLGYGSRETMNKLLPLHTIEG